MTKKYNKSAECMRYVDIKRLDFIIKSLQNHSNSDGCIKGLDLGCGIGNITISLASLGYNMIGIDISPVNVNVAKSKQINKGEDPRFLVGDAENLVFEREI